MTSLLNNLTAPADRPGDDDTELIGSRLERIDPDNFNNQSGVPETEDEALYDDSVAEDGEPDHQ